MIVRLHHLLFAMVVIGAPALAGAAERTVLIVAGQSNVLNWHADAAELPASPADEAILFYYHQGAPPSRRLPVPFNATSGGAWTRLQPQTQEPYQAHRRHFFGPEIPLARALAATGSTSLAVIKTGYFGSTLAADWRPDATAGNRLYALMLSEIRNALRQLTERGDTVRIAGFFWMQGETDGNTEAHATAYAENLQNFIARVRTDLGVADLPFVIGRVGPLPPKGCAWQQQVRDAQVKIAQGGFRTAWVDTDDLPRDTDRIHLVAAGVLGLGERWAAAWQQLTKPALAP